MRMVCDIDEDSIAAQSGVDDILVRQHGERATWTAKAVSAIFGQGYDGMVVDELVDGFLDGIADFGRSSRKVAVAADELAK